MTVNFVGDLEWLIGLPGREVTYGMAPDSVLTPHWTEVGLSWVCSAFPPSPGDGGFVEYCDRIV